MDVLIILTIFGVLSLTGGQPITELSSSPNNDAIPGLFIPADVLKELQDKAQLQNELHAPITEQKISSGAKDTEIAHENQKQEKITIVKPKQPLTNQPITNQQPMTNNQIFTPSTSQQQILTNAPNPTNVVPNQQAVISTPNESNQQIITLPGSNQAYLLSSQPIQQALLVNQQQPYLSNRQPNLSSQQPIPSNQQPTLTNQLSLVSMQPNQILLQNTNVPRQNSQIFMQNANVPSQNGQYLLQSANVPSQNGQYLLHNANMPSQNSQLLLQNSAPNQNGQYVLQKTNVPSQNGQYIMQNTNVPSQNTIVLPVNNPTTLQNNFNTGLNQNSDSRLFAIIPLQQL